MVQVVSVHAGQVQTHIRDNGETWTTGYYKAPVTVPIWVGRLGLTGDAQHHTQFHGGEHRALLLYGAEHYPLWRDEQGFELPYGAFAENLTVTTLNEDNVCLGDIFAIGDTVRVQVAQPRRPCNQINLRWNVPNLQRLVEKTYRTGWYVRVLQEGTIQVGDSLERVERPYPQWTIRQAHVAYEKRKKDRITARALAECEALEPTWRKKLGED